MSLTIAELERRRMFVTATDVPAILGVSPWMNAADVYASKTQGLTWTGNKATEAGSILEKPVLEWAETVLGPINSGDWRVHQNGIVACSLDGSLSTGEVVEAKTSGIVGPGNPSQWGEEYTDEIPDYYLLQVQTQLLVTGAARAFVPALIGNRGFVMYQVKANPDLQGVILARAEAFWVNNVQANEPPDDVRPHLDTLKRMLRVPGKSVKVDDRLAANYFRTNELAKLAQREADDAKAALIAAIGDGEIAEWSQGEFTFKEQTRKSYVCAESTFRVLREKKAPKGKSCQTAK